MSTETEIVNPTNWTAIVGIVGIVGTLIGTIIGYFGSLKMQKRQLQHSEKLLSQQQQHIDNTRFQEQRLETYSKFLQCTLHFISYSGQGLQTNEMGKEHNELSQQVILMCTSPVQKKLSLLLSITNILDNQEKGKDEQKAIRQDCYAKMRDLITAMKEELKIR